MAIVITCVLTYLGVLTVAVKRTSCFWKMVYHVKVKLLENNGGNKLSTHVTQLCVLYLVAQMESAMLTADSVTATWGILGTPAVKACSYSYYERPIIRVYILNASQRH